jgi:hypothetical protein
MASKGRRAVRATIISAYSNDVLYHLSVIEADRRTDGGGLQVVSKTTNTYREAAGKTQTPNSPTGLTYGDMQGVIERRPRALHRFRNWQHIHDTRAVTVHGGKIWQPDAECSAIRAKMREQETRTRKLDHLNAGVGHGWISATFLRKQKERAKRYADAARN